MFLFCHKNTHTQKNKLFMDETKLTKEKKISFVLVFFLLLLWIECEIESEGEFKWRANEKRNEKSFERNDTKQVFSSVFLLLTSDTLEMNHEKLLINNFSLLFSTSLMQDYVTVGGDYSSNIYNNINVNRTWMMTGNESISTATTTFERVGVVLTGKLHSLFFFAIAFSVSERCAVSITNQNYTSRWVR